MYVSRADHLVLDNQFVHIPTERFSSHPAFKETSLFNRWRPLQKKPIKKQNCGAHWTLAPKTWGTCGRGGRKSQRTWEFAVSLSTCQKLHSKSHQHKQGHNRHAKVRGSRQHCGASVYTKNCDRQLMNAESWRNCLPQARAHWFGIQKHFKES